MQFARVRVRLTYAYKALRSQSVDFTTAPPADFYRQGRRRSRCSGLPHGGVTQVFCYHTSLLCFLVNNMNTTFLIAI